MSNEAILKGEEALLRLASDKFVATFGRKPTVAAGAPGRVNLIGEHIDYCEGFVLPVALPFLTVIVGGLNDTKECRLVTILASGEELKTQFLAPTPAAPLKPGEPAWANYVKGVVANFPSPVRGFDAVIVSDVPMGSGLSSSASVEVAVFTLLEGLMGTSVDKVQKAKLCQKAEHEFPGMPCGIMDQYIVTMGKKGHALLIDCRSLESTQIPMETGDTVIMVTNSNVKHQLTGSEYPQRRAQCQEAADRLGLPSLRGAKIEDLEKLKRMKCDDLVLKRAKHVIEEIHRTELVAKTLKDKDFKRVGELFYQSHESLSKLMEVSCPELDQLVDIIRGAPGVYGARMTGGGFGGCVVTLMRAHQCNTKFSRMKLADNRLFVTSHISQLSMSMIVTSDGNPEDSHTHKLLESLQDIIHSYKNLLHSTLSLTRGEETTVNFKVKTGEVDNLKRRILSKYNGNPTFFVCQPSDGARPLMLK